MPAKIRLARTDFRSNKQFDALLMNFTRNDALIKNSIRLDIDKVEVIWVRIDKIYSLEGKELTEEQETNQ